MDLFGKTNMLFKAILLKFYLGKARADSELIYGGKST